MRSNRRLPRIDALGRPQPTIIPQPTVQPTAPLTAQPQPDPLA